jgi:uracil-DNA glycosylase family 4
LGFLLADTAPGNVRKKQENAILHQLGCKVCPLAKIKANRHPDMPAAGSDRPAVYILGEAPSVTDDKEDKHFSGASGKFLRKHIPKKFEERVRFNNVVRTRPPDSDPQPTEIECCRPSVIEDIERTRPKAIFGFGNAPLKWVSDQSGLIAWRGRRMPVKVGDHTCWYYPFQDPTWVLQQRRERKDGSIILDATGVGSEFERMFIMDMRRAFDDVERSKEQPIVHTPEMVYAGNEIIMECNADALRRIEVALGSIARSPSTGWDYETKRLRPYASDALILSAAVSDGERTVAFPFDHPEATWTKAHRADLEALWIRFLTRAKTRKIAHNLSFELEWTGEYFGADLVRASEWGDTAVQASIIDERKGKQKPGCFALEFLVQQYFGFNIKDLGGVDRKRLAETPLDRVLRYNGPDAKYAKLLDDKQMALIEREGLTVPHDLALRRVPTAVLTQLKGVPVDQKVVVSLDKKYTARIEKLEDQIEKDPTVLKFKKVFGTKFNPHSGPDVIKLFHEMLKRKECKVYDKKKKKDRLSADESVLSQIKDIALADLLLKLRQDTKRKSTYIDPLKPDSPIMWPDGLLHAIFNTYFAETGRLSCEDPNLQNYPKREEEAKEVRIPIGPAPGCKIIAIDYGQIEARVIAMFTKDPVFVKALWERYDIHMEWAERIAHAYPARIGGKKMLTDKKAMKDFRTDIKNQWTFPLFFGATLQSAANYLNIPEDNIKKEYREFWKQFAVVGQWQEEQMDFYQEKGYVECLTGRRRRGPLSKNQVFNSPVQGTAAEIIMDGMCRLSETGDPALQAEINIHDDLTFLRVPEKGVDDFLEKTLDIMLNLPFDFINVPITAEVSTGSNWMDLKEIGAVSSDQWAKN